MAELPGLGGRWLLENVRALRGTGGQMVSVDGMRLGVNRPVPRVSLPLA